MALLSKKFTLLYISPDKFPPFRVDITELFGHRLVESGHRIDWLLQSKEELKSSYLTSWHGGRAWVGKADLRGSPQSRFKKHIFALLHDLKLFRLCKKNKYDFVQVKDKFLCVFPAILACKLFDSKFIYWLSFPIPEASIASAKEKTARYPIYNFIRGRVFHFILYRVVSRYADYIFVQSEAMKQDLALKGIPNNKMMSIPMGVSSELLRNEVEEDLKIEEKSIVYLGELGKARRLDFVVDVFAEILKVIPSAKLYFIGGSSNLNDSEDLKKYCMSLGVEKNTIFTGFLPRDEALEYVKKSSVCLSPLLPSPIFDVASPTKLIEYMALGKAVVANDHPEQRTVIEQSKGGICVPYNVLSFSEAVIYLLKNPCEAKKMGSSGRRYVLETREYGVISKRLEESYLQFCK